MEAFNFTVSSLESVTFFLLPGVIFISLFFYQIPDRKRSDLQFILSSVVASAIINLFIESVLLLCKQVVLDERIVLVFAIAYSVLLAMVMADFVRSKHFFKYNVKIFGVSFYPFGRVWNAFFEVKKSTVLRVTLHDKTSYIGELTKASIDPNDDKQELELAKLYYYDKETATVKRINETESMLIKGDSIATVEKISEGAARELYN